MSNEGAVIALLVVAGIIVACTAYTISYIDSRVKQINKAIDDIQAARNALVRLVNNKKSARFHVHMPKDDK